MNVSHRCFASLAVLTLFGARSSIAQIAFDGQATNLGYAGAQSAPVSAKIRLSIADSVGGRGQLVVDPPLGGSGKAQLSMWSDSLLVVTVSAGGDTIAWLGTASTNGRFAGSYRILGGQWQGQLGTWFLVQRSGPSLPMSSSQERPFPDSVDIAAAIGLRAAVTRPSPPRAESREDSSRPASYLEFVGVLILLGFAFRFLTLLLAIPFGLLSMALTRASSDTAEVQSAWLTQASVCAIYGTLLGLIPAMYVASHQVHHSWVYVTTAFIWTYFALGANAHEKQQVRDDGFFGQTPQQSAVTQAAGIGLIVGLILLVACYNWPSMVLAVPGASTFIAWTLRVADWLVGFWIVRLILGFTMLGYVANAGLMVLLGGFALLYAVWNWVRKTFATSSPAASSMDGQRPNDR